MKNNRNYIVISIFYLAFLTYVLFWSSGYCVLFFYEVLIGVPQELDLILYGILGFYGALFGIALSYFIFFFTIGKIYKKFKADFNFKHPVLYTSIVIFILGNILFYIAMVVWSSVK